MARKEEGNAEIKRLINLVQDYAEEHRYAFITPEFMFLILLDDKKCARVIKALSKDRDKNTTVDRLKKEVSEYIEQYVEKVDKIDEIAATSAYSKLLSATVSQGGMRVMEPDSLCMLQMLLVDKEQATSWFLSRHGIYEGDVFSYLSELRKNGGSDDADDDTRVAKYAVDLTAMAKAGRIDPLIGRKPEIQRITQVLARRRGSNIVLVGEPGVGKSAVVEGLALNIVVGDVPQSLQDKKVYCLDLTSMVAGTKYRGEFEERLESFLKEIAGKDDIILFIDELHTIVGAGSSEGAMDCSNILKPYLSRGELHVIGATTYDDYKNKIEKDKALCRRFKKLDVAEPSKDETLGILKGLRKKYEEYHGIKYGDDILQSIVDLSGRYVIGRFFPDKAIDVMDEIGAKYRSGLAQGKEATQADVEAVICSMANLPSISVKADDKDRLKDLGDRIKTNLFGQDEVVDKVCRQVRMAKAGLSNPGKPLTLFLTGSTGVGKTEFAKTLASELGIGFTKLDMSEYQEDYSVSKLIGASAGYVGYEQAGALTEPLIKNPNQVILLDEIEKANHSVYDLLLQVMDDGRLTDNHGREASFKNAILIFTSNVGCANADQMSASVGFVKPEGGEGVRKQKAVEEAFKKKFSPEFRNRLTDVFYFKPLTGEVMEMIVDKNISRLEKALADKNVRISIDKKAKKLIADRASAENAGGRPVERIVNSEVSERIADEVLFGVLSENGGSANVVEKNGGIAVEFAKPKTRKTK